MIYRGFNVLPMLALVMLLSCFVLGLSGIICESWGIAGAGGVTGLVGVGLAVLSVADRRDG